MKLSAPIYRLKRRARLAARTHAIPLHAALDRVAEDEGFGSWSDLARRHAASGPAGRLLARFEPGDLVLLGARPGHGKTVLGLELALKAAGNGRQGFFFTLEYTVQDVSALLDGLEDRLVLDTSDDICAARVIDRMGAAPRGSVAVIDYLQILDQKRHNPELGTQITDLKAFAQASGSVIVLISQIDRAHDTQSGALPGLGDVRLPNPVDLSLFTRTCFLQDGEIALDPAA